MTQYKYGQFLPSISWRGPQVKMIQTILPFSCIFVINPARSSIGAVLTLVQTLVSVNLSVQSFTQRRAPLKIITLPKDLTRAKIRQVL